MAASLGNGSGGNGGSNLKKDTAVTKMLNGITSHMTETAVIQLHSM